MDNTVPVVGVAICGVTICAVTICGVVFKAPAAIGTHTPAFKLLVGLLKNPLRLPCVAIKR